MCNKFSTLLLSAFQEIQMEQKCLKSVTEYVSSVLFQKVNFNGLVEACNISSALVMEIYMYVLQSYSISHSFTLILGWGFLKLHSIIFLVKEVLIFQEYLLGSLNHFHIWQVSPQHSCGDTCQIWTWYLVGNHCFDNGKKSGKRMSWMKLV